MAPSVTFDHERFCGDNNESGICEATSKIDSGDPTDTPVDPSGLEDTSSADHSRRFVDLGYEPFPKQREFHASRAKYRLFGGAAGPGKSKALLMEAILQAHEVPGANT